MKPIIKVSSADSIGDNCDTNIKSKQPNLIEQIIDDSTKDHRVPACPTYENLDFLKNDKMFSKDTEKHVSVQNLANTKLKTVDKAQFLKHHNENNLKENTFNVNLRTVPKNFTRNRFIKECKKELEDRHVLLAKQSNLSLGSMNAATSPVTEKFVNISSNFPNKSNLKESNLGTKQFEANSGSHSSKTPFGVFSPEPISRNIPERCSLSRRRYTRDSDDSPVPKRTPLLQRKSTTSKFYSANTDEQTKEDEPSGILAKVLRRTPIFERKTFKPTQLDHSQKIPEEHSRSKTQMILNKERIDAPSTSAFKGASSNVVRSIVDSLNRKSGGLSFGNRGGYGRSSLKVIGSPKVNLKGVVRGSLDTEFTAL